MSSSLLASSGSPGPSDWARERLAGAAERIKPLASRHTASVQSRLERVLEAFAAERVGAHHFASVSGYGHGDQGRDVLDRVFARVLQAEAAAVRLQFVSGTHAIAAVLFGVLRPGDRLLALTGRPYDTLEEVIGLRGRGHGSLMDYGIRYEELDLTPQGRVNLDAVEDALAVPTRMVFNHDSLGFQALGDTIRLTGTNEEEAVEILQRAGFAAMTDMDEVVKAAVRLAHGGNG